MLIKKTTTLSGKNSKKVLIPLYILLIILTIGLLLSGYFIYKLRQDNLRLSNEYKDRSSLVYEKYLEYQLPRERERANQAEKELTDLKEKYSTLENNCRGGSETNTTYYQNNSINCTTNKIGDYIYTNCR